MPSNKFKRKVRARMDETGETFQQARNAMLAEEAEQAERDAQYQATADAHRKWLAERPDDHFKAMGEFCRIAPADTAMGLYRWCLDIEEAREVPGRQRYTAWVEHHGDNLINLDFDLHANPNLTADHITTIVDDFHNGPDGYPWITMLLHHPNCPDGLLKWFHEPPDDAYSHGDHADDRPDAVDISGLRDGCHTEGNTPDPLSAALMAGTSVDLDEHDVRRVHVVIALSTDHADPGLLADLLGRVDNSNGIDFDGMAALAMHFGRGDLEQWARDTGADHPDRIDWQTIVDKRRRKYEQQQYQWEIDNGRRLADGTPIDEVDIPELPDDWYGPPLPDMPIHGKPGRPSALDRRNAMRYARTYGSEAVAEHYGVKPKTVESWFRSSPWNTADWATWLRPFEKAYDGLPVDGVLYADSRGVDGMVVWPDLSYDYDGPISGATGCAVMHLGPNGELREVVQPDDYDDLLAVVARWHDIAPEDAAAKWHDLLHWDGTPRAVPPNCPARVLAAIGQPQTEASTQWWFAGATLEQRTAGM